jgi:dUTP pyrophosphatase
VNLGPKDLLIKKGERIGQGIFMKYLTADNEAPVTSQRVGGFGSSGK